MKQNINFVHNAELQEPQNPKTPKPREEMIVESEFKSTKMP